MGNRIVLVDGDGSELYVYSSLAASIAMKSNPALSMQEVNTPTVEESGLDGSLDEFPVLQEVSEIINRQTLPIEAWSMQDLQTIGQLYRWGGWHNMKHDTLVSRVKEVLPHYVNHDDV